MKVNIKDNRAIYTDATIEEIIEISKRETLLKIVKQLSDIIKNIRNITQHNRKIDKTYVPMSKQEKNYNLYILEKCIKEFAECA